MMAGSWSKQETWPPLAIALPPEEQPKYLRANPSEQSSSLPPHSNLLAIAGIFAVFALTSAGAVPGVNETHYLTKAKHFWNPAWCGNDLFLVSSDAHYAFFALLGWPTLFLSLDVYAWIGRLVCWTAMAYAWFRLNRTCSIANWLMPFTAAIFALLSNHFDMAGEWVVGGFEAKSITYVFVVLALDCFVKQRWNQFWIHLGVACLFHLVIGVWALICFIIAKLLAPARLWLKLPTKMRDVPGALLIFVVLCIAAIVPAISSDVSTPKEIVVAANQIQVHQRLAHHLLFGSLETIQIAKFVLIAILWSVVSTYSVALAKDRSIHFSLRRFCLASLTISIAGLMLSGIAEGQGTGRDFANLLLKFYWFRFADFAIPMGLAICFGVACNGILNSRVVSKKVPCWIALIALSLATLATTIEIFKDRRPTAAQASLPLYESDPMRTTQTFENFVAACRWVAANTPPDSTFVTPIDQQIFKWYSDRAEVACWKDAPQDAIGIVEWRRRVQWLSSFNAVPAGIMQLNTVQAQAMNEQTGATHIFAPQALEDLALEHGLMGDSLKKVFPPDPTTRSTYVVYEIVVE